METAVSNHSGVAVRELGVCSQRGRVVGVGLIQAQHRLGPFYHVQ